jgi:hypothetical protein
MLVSAGQSLFYMASIINMTNCVEYNDFKHGERSEAVVSTLRPFMAKFGSAMHTLLITLTLAVSGTFLLSQSISTLETQRDFFDQQDEATQGYYITQMQSYFGAYEGLEQGTDEYDAAAERISAEIMADDVMKGFQIDAAYVPAMEEAMVVKVTADGEAEIGRLGELDASQIVDDGGTYSLKIDDLDSGDESAANLSFRDQRTTTMRVWVRLSCTILPALLLFAALYTQKKKFVIDEDYYDKMMTEINRRNQENGQA